MKTLIEKLIDSVSEIKTNQYEPDELEKMFPFNPKGTPYGPFSGFEHINKWFVGSLEPGDVFVFFGTDYYGIGNNFSTFIAIGRVIKFSPDRKKLAAIVDGEMIYLDSSFWCVSYLDYLEIDKNPNITLNDYPGFKKSVFRTEPF